MILPKEKTAAYRRTAYDRPVSRTSKRGFTLVELIAVIVALGLLVGLAVPLYLQKRQDAQDRVTQVALKSTYEGAKADYIIDGSWPETDKMVERLSFSEPGLHFQEAPATDKNPDEIQVIVDDDGKTLTLCSQSESGRVFCLRANEEGELQS